MNSDPIGQVPREDLAVPYFWVVQPEHAHVQLSTFHSIIGYCPALFFLALDWGWLHSTFGCRGVTLVSSRSAVSEFTLVGGIRS